MYYFETQLQSPCVYLFLVQQYRSVLLVAHPGGHGRISMAIFPHFYNWKYLSKFSTLKEDFRRLSYTLFFITVRSYYVRMD